MVQMLYQWFFFLSDNAEVCVNGLQVYTVATDQVIENLMSQYKRHKHQRSMPNFIRAPKFQRKPKIPRREAVDEAIDKQQTSSIMKVIKSYWSIFLKAAFKLPELRVQRTTF